MNSAGGSLHGHMDNPFRRPAAQRASHGPSRSSPASDSVRTGRSRSWEGRVPPHLVRHRGGGLRDGFPRRTR
ncbi:hypothetical protein STXM2123_400 [Streptomyces sp. F-3]|nr:hypothetical protein STXM2123_400 [Streptomyces sp. F-3]